MNLTSNRFIPFTKNSFCTGQHPCYNGKNGVPLARFDGSKGTRKFYIDNKNHGYLVRESEKIAETNMVLGTLQRVTFLGNLKSIIAKQSKYHHGGILCKGYGRGHCLLLQRCQWFVHKVPWAIERKRSLLSIGWLCGVPWSAQWKQRQIVPVGPYGL